MGGATGQLLSSLKIRILLASQFIDRKPGDSSVPKAAVQVWGP